MKLAATLMAVLAAGLLIAGLAIGFGVGVTDGRGYDCGSALKESSELFSDQLVDTMTGGNGETDCDAARGAAKPLPIVLLVLGGVVGVGAFIVRSQQPRVEQV